jgi:C1A family cysteine protease
MRQLGSTHVLAPEQITQCAKGSFGCGGGWTETAYAYVMNSNGVVDESDYPYTSADGTTGECKVDTSKGKIGVTKFYTITGEDQMAAYVQQTGPLSVCLDASQFNSYTGGVMSYCTNNVNHCVQAVGVDASANGYWVVRNSWGTSWGESGYIRLTYGKNLCDITHDPTWVQTK